MRDLIDSDDDLFPYVVELQFPTILFPREQIDYYGGILRIVSSYMCVVCVHSFHTTVL